MKLIKTIAALGVATLLGASGGASAQQLGIGTMGQGTSGYSMGAAIASVLAANDVNALVQPAAGTSAFLPLVQSGELDLGIANIIEISEAVQGQAAFEGRPLDNLRAVARLFPFYSGIFVRADSDIKTIADLKGKRVAAGYTSQVTLQRVLEALLATGGLTADDIEPVLVPNVVRGADAFSSGQADAAVFAIGSGKVAEVDAAVGGLRFLPIETDEAAVKRMKAVLPEGYPTVVKPAPSRAGVPNDLPAMAYDYMLAAGAHVPDETIERVVMVLHENKEALAASFGNFKGFEPDSMHPELPVDYHAGAEKAYEKLGQ